jgi:hypothetical protein
VGSEMCIRDRYVYSVFVEFPHIVKPCVKIYIIFRLCISQTLVFIFLTYFNQNDTIQGPDNYVIF